MENLPSVADFENAQKTFDPAMKWRDLPVGRYIIREQKFVDVKCRKAMILTLSPFEDRGKTVSVWASDRLVNDLTEPGNEDVKYVMNKGQKVSTKNPAYAYFSYILL